VSDEGSGGKCPAFRSVSGRRETGRAVLENNVRLTAIRTLAKRRYPRRRQCCSRLLLPLVRPRDLRHDGKAMATTASVLWTTMTSDVGDSPPAAAINCFSAECVEN